MTASRRVIEIEYRFFQNSRNCRRALNNEWNTLSKSTKRVGERQSLHNAARCGVALMAGKMRNSEGSYDPI